MANQSVTITASNFASAISSVTTGLYSEAECATPITSGAWVKDITVNAAKTAVTFNVDDNETGAARECWLKVSATDGTGNASAAVHVAQKKIVVDYATLPFSFTGGRADIETTDGMTQNGLGTDYGVTEKLKFDGTGDWLKIKINADPGKLSYQIKGNSFSGGTFTIQQSADDETYSDLATYTADGSVELALAKTTRYVKFIYTNKSSGNIGLGNIAISEYVAPAAVATPVISGDDPFLTETEVSITCETAGATIYYTTTESAKGTPATSGDWIAYDSENKPSFNATTTVWAAAIKGSDWSSVAEKTFTKTTALTTMDGIFAAASTAGNYYITFSSSWVVTGVSTNGKNVYITDGTKGMILYNSGANMGLVVGNTLSGTVQRSLKLYSGAAQLDAFTTEGLTIGTGSQPVVQELDAAGIEALNGANTGSLIKISGECSEESGKFKIGGVQLYNSLYSFSVSAGTSYECTGVYVQYNTSTANTKEILPRNAEDIVVSSSIAVTGVELTESTATVEVGLTVTLHASVVPGTATDKAIVWTVESGSDKASVDNGVVTGIAEGTAVIRAASHEDATIYQECTVTVTAADPTKHVVTFDATVDMGESPLSKNNITFTCSNGILNNGTEYRLYKSSTTTFECSVGNIIKIEFTGVSGNPVSGFGDPEVGTLVTEGNNGVWTGNAESVSFVASGAQVRATEIVVTYKEDNRAAAGLAWSTDAVELTVGDEFTAPSLTNPHSLTVSIESDNTSLATVTAGVVSLVADATGTATITATFNGNDDYKPATVSYNITVNEAGLDNVTFDSSEDHAESGETTITKSGFTLSFTSGSMDGTQAEYRLYKSQTMTLSSTDYLIKKIEFTCTSGNPISGFADATGLDKDNNEWTGESNTVELTASNAQVRMTKIKVFYVEDTRAAAGLAWNPADDIELTVGGAFSAPALLNPNGIDAAEISIASSNTDVATVTAGVVALVADATGEATITATFAGNASYKPATVSYKITVNPAYSIYVQPSLNVNFGSVNQNAEVADKSITVTLTGVDAATLTLEGTGASAFSISPAAALTASGDIAISASSANIGTFAATLTISDDANNAESKVVNISITVNEVVTPETPVSTTSEWVAATEIVNGMQVLIVGERNEKIYAVGAQTSNNRTAVEGSLSEGVFTPGENTMAFTVVAQEGGTYALQASNGKYLYAAGSGSGKNYLRSQDEVDDNAKWTLSVSSATANGTNTNNKLQLNNSSDIFSCYSSTQKAIKLYVPQSVTPEPPTADYTRDGLTAGNYATICLPNGGTISGATLFDLEYYDGASTLYLLQVNGNAMVAGRPYIFLPDATSIEVTYTDDANEPAGSYNGLVGSYTKAEVAIGTGDAANYILYQNAYYLVNSTAYVGANRAYIHMADVPKNPSTPQAGDAPRRRVAMTVNGATEAQGVENIGASEKPMKMVIDGQLFILRGEKMYDATGRLVK